MKPRIPAAAIVASLIAAAPLAASPARAATASDCPAGLNEGKRVTILDEGSGPDVVLIPGLATPRAVWDATAARLKDRYRLHIVQVRGFGDAAGVNAEGAVLEPMVREIADYIDDCIVDQGRPAPAIIGHSMGGLAAMMIGVRAPGEAGKLMIVDALPFFAVLMAPPGIDPTVAMVEPQAAKMRDGIAASYGKPADAATIAAQTRGMAIKPDSIAAIEGWAAGADARVTAQLIYDDLTTDLRPELATIAAPITLVYPWNDTGPGKDMVDGFYRQQYQRAPTVRYVAIGDAGHFAMLDQPEAFAAAVDDFLRD